MRRCADRLLSRGWIALLALGIAGPAGAFPVSAPYSDGATCDSIHPEPTLTHELGTGAAFPMDESIVVSSIVPISGIFGCVIADLVNDHLITILNTSGRPWQDLYFVADPGFGFFNRDGIIASGGLQGLLAFKIDSVGGNTSLVESIAADGIFEPGESWTFAVINFGDGVTPGLVPSFGSLGLDAAGTDSNASIVANPAPTPMPLVGMGLVGIAIVGVGLVLLSRRT